MTGLRRTVAVVAALNFGYFLFEFGVARTIYAISLYADSIDFLEDATVNLLILIALGWSAARRSQVGMLLAAVLLLPGIATLWAVGQKFLDPVAPQALALTLTGAGALLINVGCAFLLARYRRAAGSLTRAAFLSARNDAVANVAIIAAGLATAVSRSHWPDLVVGIGIFLLNADAAKEVYTAARAERD